MAVASEPAAFGDGQLTHFCDNLWTAATPVRFVGTWFPHVMTVIRLRGGGLLLHSPCKPSDALRNQLSVLGNVAHVVAPNWFHDLYLSRYRAIYPEAIFWGPARLRKYIDRVPDETPPPWSGELPHFTLSGLLTFDESLFFHRPTRTLIAADLFMNVRADADAPPITKLGYRLFGMNGTVKVFPVLRLFGLGPARASLKRAAREISKWEPERLILAHGTPVQQITAAEIRKALHA